MLPVPLLTGIGASFLTSEIVLLTIALTGPRREGFLASAEVPSVPVTRSLRAQSSPVIRNPESWPSPVTRDLTRPSISAGSAASMTDEELTEPLPKRASSVPVTLPWAIPNGPVICPCS